MNAQAVTTHDQLILDELEDPKEAPAPARGCQSVSSSPVVREAVAVAREEYVAWGRLGLREPTKADHRRVVRGGVVPPGYARVRLFFQSTTDRDARVRRLLASRSAWSAAFISYLFCAGYLRVAEGKRTALTDINADDIRRAMSCLRDQNLFFVSAGHIGYLRRYASRGRNRPLLEATEPLKIGDLVCNGRSGLRYRLSRQGRAIQKYDPRGRRWVGLGAKVNGSKLNLSHCDIVVDIVDWRGIRAAVVVGGNTGQRVWNRRRRKLVPHSGRPRNAVAAKVLPLDPASGALARSVPSATPAAHRREVAAHVRRYSRPIFAILRA